MIQSIVSICDILAGDMVSCAFVSIAKQIETGNLNCVKGEVIIELNHVEAGAGCGHGE